MVLQIDLIKIFIYYIKINIQQRNLKMAEAFKKKRKSQKKKLKLMCVDT